MRRRVSGSYASPDSEDVSDRGSVSPLPKCWGMYGRELVLGGGGGGGSTSAGLVSDTCDSQLRLTGPSWAGTMLSWSSLGVLGPPLEDEAEEPGRVDTGAIACLRPFSSEREKEPLDRLPSRPERTLVVTAEALEAWLACERSECSA